MALRINILHYNGIVFRQDHLSCEKKTGSLCLALVALIAGRLADEIGLDFESLKSSTD